MKTLFVISLLSFFLTNHGFGQVINPDTLCMHPEVEADFPGGDFAWRRFLLIRLDTTVAYKNNAPKGKYVVILKFIVNRDGIVSNITAETNVGYGMEEAAIRMLTKYGPKWKPASCGGAAARAFRRQPITFNIE